MTHTITKDVEMSAIDAQWQGSKDTVGSSLASAVSSRAELIKDNGEVKERETWDNKFQYILAVVGFAVGLGNVWRFPYLVQKNGGGAFLIPYTIMLIIEGIPIFYLELAVGQRLRKGAIGAWNEISPYLGGIGIASAVVSFNVALYYNTIIAWCLYYMGQSFQYPLPWASCPEAAVNGTNITAPVTECQLAGAPSYFWYRETLAITPSIDISGAPNWWLVLSLVGAWAIVFACMVKGIASSGKVVYFTATFPYLVLVIFFVRGVTLDRFYLGLEHLFVPEWSRLADPQVWLEAATQIFFSLGLAFGGLVAFSSYMPVRNNCYRDAILVSLTNCATSIFAGIVVFSILGYKASQTFDTCMIQQNNELISLFNTTDVVVPTAGELVNFTRLDDNTGMWIQELGIMPNITQCNFKEEIGKSASGTGLAFIAFTEAINQFPGATFWAIIFFLMLLTLGLDSMFGTLEGVVTSLVDMKLLPMLPKWAISAIICLVSLALSLCFSTGSGSYVLTLFDDFTGNIPLMMIALFQVIAISYVYGLKRFSDDIELMTGSRPNWYFLIMWRYISPLAMTGILIASVVNMIANGISYEAYVAETASVIRLAWPGWAQFLAGLFIVSSVIWIPIVAILKYFNISVLAEQEPAFFPTEELKNERNFKPYKASTWEHYLFYWGEK